MKDWLLGYYILDEDDNPVHVDDVLEWGRWFEKANRHVASDTVDGVHVSTVFLGLNHRFGPGAPLLWETMIFGGEHDHFQRRYFTKKGAIAGHNKAVKMVKKSLNKSDNEQKSDNRGDQETSDVAGDEPLY